MTVEIKVLSALAAREAYLELVPQFEHGTGHKVTTTWAASCGTMKYELKVSREGKSVVLSRSDGVEADLSATTLGARLLDEDVLAEVGFNCPMHALNIFLKGVKLVDQIGRAHV